MDRRSLYLSLVLPILLFATLTAANAEPGFNVYNYVVYPQTVLGGRVVHGTPSSMYVDTLGQERIIEAYLSSYGTAYQGACQSAATTALTPANQHRLVNLDEEYWDNQRFNPPAVAPNLLNVLGTFKASNSTSRTGFYAEVPQNTFSSSNPAPTYDSLNNAYAPVAAAVDYFAPSLYNYGGTDANWLIQAQYAIQQCNKFNAENSTNKPIYPYISPEITDSSGVKRSLTYAEMMYRLTTLRSLGANGAVLWASSGFVDSNNNPGTYGANIGWQTAVTDFNKSNAPAVTVSGGTTVLIQDASTNGAVAFGAMNLQGGNLQFNPGASAPTQYFRNYVNDINVQANAAISADDGTVDLLGNISVAANKTLTVGSAGAGKTLYIDGQISGDGSLVVQPNGLTLDGYMTGNSGVVTLGGPNTFGGGTSLLNGTTVLGGGSVLGTGPIAMNGGNLAFDQGNIPANLDPGYAVPAISSCNNNIAVNATGSIAVYSGTATLGSSIAIANSAALTLRFTGAGARLLVSGTVASSGGAIALNASAGSTAVDFQPGSQVTANGISVYDTGWSQKTLNSAGSVLNNGSLVIQHDSVVNITGGTWRQTGGVSLGQAYTVSYADLYLTGGLFVYTGSGAIALKQTVESMVNFAVDGGTLATKQGFWCNGGQGAHNNIDLDAGGTIQLLANVSQFTVNNPLFSLGSSGGVFNTNGFSTTITSSITGSGTLTKAGLGTLVLSGSANRFAGLDVIDGEILISGAGAAPAGASLTVGRDASRLFAPPAPEVASAPAAVPEPSTLVLLTVAAALPIVVRKAAGRNCARLFCKGLS